MLVYAALVPHSPILVPEVGREHTKKLKKTLGAIAHIKQELAEAAPETILIISPHGAIFADAFTINLAHEYTGGLTEFGNFRNTYTYRPDTHTVDHMQRHLRRVSPLQLHSEVNLDYGTAVPLLLLTEPGARVIPLHTTLLDAKEHFKFGDLLKNEVYETGRRIAILASADFTNTPPDVGAPRVRGTHTLDKQIVDCITHRNAAGLISLDQQAVRFAKMCGYGPTVVLHGLLERVIATPQVISYENPFGVGYITASFHLGS